MSTATFTLYTGAYIPAIGTTSYKKTHCLGTSRSPPNEVGNAIKCALDAGYRHLDLATVYRNEPEIGQALKSWFTENPQVKRSDIFITSKLWNTKHRPELVAQAYAKTLTDLQLDYLDLYLMHWPIALVPNPDNPDDLAPKLPNGKPHTETDTVKIIDTWKAMEALYTSKRVKAIGVSNFNIPTLKYLHEIANIKPTVNQIELHPYLPQEEMLTVANQLNVHLTAHTPLGSSYTSEHNLREDPVLVAIAKKHNVTAAQVCIAWGVQRNTSVIPKSVNPNRIRVNLTPVKLDIEDLVQISTLAQVNHRYCDPFVFSGVDVFLNKVHE